MSVDWRGIFRTLLVTFCIEIEGAQILFDHPVYKCGKGPHNKGWLGASWTLYRRVCENDVCCSVIITYFATWKHGFAVSPLNTDASRFFFWGGWERGVSNQQSEYSVFHELMCWQSLTFRLSNVMSPLQRGDLLYRVTGRMRGLKPKFN
jgi:hypothetical protein